MADSKLRPTSIAAAGSVGRSRGLVRTFLLVASICNSVILSYVDTDSCQPVYDWLRQNHVIFHFQPGVVGAALFNHQLGISSDTEDL